MKKVKTILSGIFIALACVLVSACSCSGTADAVQVYPNTIEINLAYGSSGVKGEYDSTSGILNIECHVGDTFGIRYNLAPNNTTATQVDWSFGTTGLVTPVQRDFSRSRSIEEVVEFRAITRSDAVYTTSLLFSTQPSGASSKKATCNITVYKAIENLPIFVAPKNINFDNNTGNLTWDAVTRVTLNGVESNAVTSQGYPLGLTHYKVNLTDEGTGDTKSIDVPYSQTSLNFKGNGIEDGKTYSITVEAIADGNNAISSEKSTTFKMYKLLQPTNVTVGKSADFDYTELKFTTPLYSNNNKVFYYGIAESYATSLSSADSTEISINADSKFTRELGNTYSVQIISYPTGYSEENGYGTRDGIRLYPSEPTSPIAIERLLEPTVNLVDKRATAGVGGATFVGDGEIMPHTTTAIVWSIGDKVYDTNINHEYQYTVYKLSGDVRQSVKNGKTSATAVDSILSGLDAGSYEVEVKSVGNDSNTISSAMVSMKFNILPQLTKESLTLNEDILKISGIETAGGIELFFVNKNSGESKWIEINEPSTLGYDLSTLGVGAGNYELYARLICNISDDPEIKNAMVVPAAYSTSLLTLKIAGMVSGNIDGFTAPVIDGDGNIRFSKVDDFEKYAIIVKQTNRGEDSAFDKIVIHPNNSLEDENLHYTLDGTTIKFNILDVMQKIVDNFKGVPGADSLTLDRLLVSSNSFKFAIVTCGSDDKDTPIISSSPTADVVFSSAEPVSSITLQDYHIYFNSASGYLPTQQFVVSLVTDMDGEPQETIFTDATAYKGSDGNFDINLFSLQGEHGESFDELLNRAKSNTIVLRAKGRTGYAGNPALLNSLPTSTTFSVAGNISNIKLDDSGRLTWSSSTESETLKNNSDSYNYTIKFYTVEKSDTTKYTLLSDDVVYNAPVVLSDDGANVDLSYAGIKEILAKYTDTLIAITITENKSDMFSGNESEYFYATIVSSPQVQKKLSETNYTLTWQEIKNATVYDISYNADNGINGTVTGHGDTTFNISNMITAENTPWTVGKYTISIVAKSENLGNNSIDTPFVLSSVESVVTIYLISKSIEVRADGTYLLWDDILEGTGYEASYSMSYTLADESVSQTQNLNSTYQFDASSFKEGSNSVTITPSVDYESVGGNDVGIILIGSTRTNAITKWKKADKLSTVNGNLVFNVYGATDDSHVVIELYEGDSGSEKLVSPSNYKQSVSTVGTESDMHLQYVISIDGLNEGSLKFSVIVRSEGTLNSDRSDYCEGTKLSVVTDFEKQGEWLVWSAQEGVTGYQINYKKPGEDAFSSLVLTVEKQGEDGYKCLVPDTDDDSRTTTDESRFTFDKENNKFKLKFDEALFISGVTGDTRLTIKPLTETEKYFNGNTSTPVVITKLNANVSITVEDGKIRIGNYEADGSASPISYKISIYAMETKTEMDGEETQEVLTNKQDENGENIVWEHTDSYTPKEGVDNIEPIDLNAVGLLSDGVYKIILMFLGDGDNAEEGINNIILNSAIVTGENGVIANKLKISNPFTENGQVVWNNEDSTAESYTFRVNDGEVDYDFTITADTNKTVLDEKTLTITTETEPEPDGEPTISTTQFTFQPGKEYKVKILANARGLLSSNWSEELTVKKLYAPSDVKITSNKQKDLSVVVDDEESTQNIEVGAPIITWTSKNKLGNEQYLGYELTYLGLGDTKVVNVHASGVELYPLDTTMEIGTYQLRLKTIGNTTAGTDISEKVGLLSSDYQTERVDANYGDETASVEILGGVVKWAQVPGAYSYRVSVYKTDKYNEWLGDTSKEIADEDRVFETYVGMESVDFATLNISRSVDFSGSYTFVVNALTEPNVNIISTSDTSISAYKNHAEMYRPAVPGDFKVKDGLLNYRISIKDIKEFVDSTMADGATKLALGEDGGDNVSTLVKYVVDRVNGSVEPNTELDEQISHLIYINLNINGSIVLDLPTSAVVLKSDGSVASESDYTKEDSYIEYNYNVGIEPDFTGVDVEPVEPTEPELPLPAPTEVSDKQYSAGRYDIRISFVGNSVMTTPVVSSGYTVNLTAYKPNTPITWSTGGSDIDKGKVQWGLSTTQDSKLDKFIYYKDYKIEAVTLGNGQQINSSYYKIVSIDETKSEVDGTNPNLIDSYKYYRDLKDDLFTTNVDKDSPDTQTNRILANTNYRLLISTIGTKDSSELESGETVYLNSNKCVVGSVANILTVSSNVKVSNSNLTWKTSNGSTATRVYVYGPFENVDNKDDKTKVKLKADWKDELLPTHLEDGESWTNIQELNRYKDMYYHPEKADDFKDEWHVDNVDKYKDKLHIIDLDDTVRSAGFTLTDYVLNDERFAEGGYILSLQELGDEKGIIDSPEGRYVAVNKLGTPKAQSSGWVGTGSSGIYEWTRSSTSAEGIDTWSDRQYSLDPPSNDERIGNFVWEPVALANAYKVELFELAPGADLANKISESFVRETVYELVSGEAYNQEGYRYFIRITSLRTDLDDPTKLVDNYFSSDYADTSSHLRLPIPIELTVYGSGRITWNTDISYENIGQYRVRYNFGGEQNASSVEVRTLVSGNTSSVPETPAEYYMGDYGQSGTISIAVKALAKEVDNNESALLNSSYCNPRTVTRLTDPDVRVVDGVFNWGTAGDPLSSSNLDINDTKYYISQESMQTYFEYFTNITEHDGKYEAKSDEELFPTGSKTFTVYFEGSGGDDGVLMDGDQNFFIASNKKTLQATKLNTPKAENARIDISGTMSNRVVFDRVENALGYKVRIFFVSGDIKETTDLVVTNQTLEELKSSGESTGANANYFSVDKDTDKIYVVLDSFLEDIIRNTDTVSENGASMYVYVQAMGSGISGAVAGDSPARPEFSEAEKPTQNNQLYINSSFSDYTTIAIPPMPGTISFDSATGTVSWEFDSTDKFSIKLVTKYTVSGVTSDELTNYWQKTADQYKQQNAEAYTQVTDKIDRYSEIVRREFTYTTDNGNYTLNVVDTIRVKSNGKETPTNYQLTVIGTNYQFEVTAIAFDGDDNGESDEFASPTRVSENNHTFNTFGKGDGSKNYPYTVSSFAELNSIRYFMTRDFTIQNNITLNSTGDSAEVWNTMLGEFTGTIEGNSHTISGINLDKSNSNGDTKSFVETIGVGGTIKNITFNLDTTITGVYDSLYVSGVAITNRGTIENVTVSGKIEANSSSTTKGGVTTQVAGIAINNYGTISNATVSAELRATHGGESSSVGGIATNNLGTGSITNSTSTGKLYGNNVGGICATNNGKIDYCSVSGEIHVTNKAQNGQYTNMAYAGGITAFLRNADINTSPTITASYSIAKIYVECGQNNSSNSVTVGGLVASITDSDSITIKNNYVVMNIYAESSATVTSNNLTVYDMIGSISSRKATMEHNYYFTEHNDTQISLSNASLNEQNVCEKCTSLDDLKSKLSSLQDDSGKTIYETNNLGSEGDGKYPTFKKND